MPLLWLLTLLAVPVVEVWFMIQVAHVIGAWQTALLLILVSAAGVWLVKREGRRAWRALSQATNQRQPPSKELADGALLLVGGVLLLVPGFLTSLVGLLFVLPVFRPLTRRLVGWYARRRGVAVRLPGRAGPTVVQGQVVDEDPGSGGGSSTQGPGTQAHRTQAHGTQGLGPEGPPMLGPRQR